MKSARLFGKKVLGRRGFRLGTGVGVHFDEYSGKVISLDVRLFRRVAEEFRKHRVLVRTRREVGLRSIPEIGDRVILTVFKTEL